MTLKRSTTFALTLFAFLHTLQASAQSEEGFSVDRFAPAAPGSDWHANESLDFRGMARPAISAVADWSDRPMVVYQRGGDELAEVFSQRTVLNVSAGVVLLERIRVTANLPLLLGSSGEDLSTEPANFETHEGAALGDARLGLDIRLLGSYAGPFSAAMGAQIHAPTGSREAYMSDGGFGVEPRIMLAGEIGAFAYAGRLSFRYRNVTGEIGGATLGNDVVLATAAGVRLIDRRLLVGPEAIASTVASAGISAFEEQNTPLELLLGAKYSFEDGLRIGIAAGPGLTRGLGSPDARAVASVEWIPMLDPAPCPKLLDSDDDGIEDALDACPGKPGQANAHPGLHGCPLPVDTDNDSVLDANDACPLEPGTPSDIATTAGCPDVPDSDGDGISDPEDACAEAAGELSEDKATSGCPPPPPDEDGDGITDSADACPDKAGPASETPSMHGCPRAVLDAETKQIRILEPIEFEENAATISPDSSTLLMAVKAILDAEPGVLVLSIEGHTDNRGAAWQNKRLSAERAQAVRAWLVDRGVAAERVVAVGRGAEKPIDTNETDTGRQNNRRVEFHITREAQQEPENANQPVN